jgi:hypothetical protein
MGAGNYLAVICLFFGADTQVVNVLGQLLVFGVKLSDTIMARCARYAANLPNALLNWAGRACIELVGYLSPRPGCRRTDKIS